MSEKVFAFCPKGQHKFIIESVAKLTNCNTYLELGVHVGDTFSTMCRATTRAIGVDVNDRRFEKVGEFHQCTTDEFFSYFKDKVDIVFIDADHKFESVVKDFEHSLLLLNKYGIIFLHDTDPMTEEFLDYRLCGDSYRIVDYIREKHPELNVTTLPITEAGLSIVNRKNDRRVLSYLK